MFLNSYVSMASKLSETGCILHNRAFFLLNSWAQTCLWVWVGVLLLKLADVFGWCMVSRACLLSNHSGDNYLLWGRAPWPQANYKQRGYLLYFYQHNHATDNVIDIQQINMAVFVSPLLFINFNLLIHGFRSFKKYNIWVYCSWSLKKIIWKHGI